MDRNIENNEEPGLLAGLRAVVPKRPLHFREALTLADMQASRLLRFCGAVETPIDDAAITSLPRISIEHRELPTSGLSFWDGKRWVICLNDSEPTTRQRFTLLHEFKHIIDHGQTGQLYPGRDLGAQQRAERAADYFAGCVLMPRPLVKQAWSEGLQSLGELADIFDVSLSAMRVRLIQLGLAGTPPRCRRTPQGSDVGAAA